MSVHEWGCNSNGSGGTGNNPSIESLFASLKRMKNKNEIPVGINTFYPLPLSEPLNGHLFYSCPAGIAVTDQRLWVSHNVFSSPEDGENLWKTWSRFESLPPRYLLAFGKLDYKVERLSAAMLQRTNGGSIQNHVVPSTGGIGEYTLTITPKDNLLVVEFVENGQTDGAHVEIDLAK